MPHDSIMDVVNNVEALYLDAQGLYAKWYRLSTWSRKDALAEAKRLAKHFADSIGGYGERAVATAANEMVDEYLTDYKPYRDGKSKSSNPNYMGSHDTGSLDVIMVDQTGAKRLRARIAVETLVGDIIPMIVTKMGLPITAPDNTPMSYSLDWKEGGVRLLETQTLSEAGVRSGESLMIYPEIIAGEMSGSCCLGDAESLDVIMVDQTGAKRLRAKIAAETLVGDIIPMIVTKMGLPITAPDNTPMSYSLDWKEGGVRLLETQTLSEAGVRTGESLMIYPEIIAGEMSGSCLGES